MFTIACVLGAILLFTCFAKSWRNTHQTYSKYDWSVYWLVFCLICKFHWFWSSNHYLFWNRRVKILACSLKWSVTLFGKWYYNMLVNTCDRETPFVLRCMYSVVSELNITPIFPIHETHRRFLRDIQDVGNVDYCIITDHWSIDCITEKFICFIVKNWDQSLWQWWVLKL